MENIYESAKALTKELLEIANVKPGGILVVGCSTSEVVGEKIGTNSDPGVAEELYRGIKEAADKAGVFLAAQCCEHLNRAIVTERQAVPFADSVNVIPQKKAGGSFATCAYHNAKDPVVVEEIKADAGIDIGGTLIGMHLKSVAVPVRLSRRQLGNAIIIAARTRGKFIGGERAVYNKDLM